jgi:hypothetical protein
MARLFSDIRKTGQVRVLCMFRRNRQELDLLRSKAMPALLCSQEGAECRRVRRNDVVGAAFFIGPFVNASCVNGYKRECARTAPVNPWSSSPCSFLLPCEYDLLCYHVDPHLKSHACQYRLNHTTPELREAGMGRRHPLRDTHTPLICISF